MVTGLSCVSGQDEEAREILQAELEEYFPYDPFEIKAMRLLPQSKCNNI